MIVISAWCTPFSTRFHNSVFDLTRWRSGTNHLYFSSSRTKNARSSPTQDNEASERNWAKTYLSSPVREESPYVKLAICVLAYAQYSLNWLHNQAHRWAETCLCLDSCNHFLFKPCQVASVQSATIVEFFFPVAFAA